ncbi:MAG: hypothetical protein JWM44_109 [Bacilli bacterium]|nr:hypothetical protein [Bacilli bacterium]
MFKNKGFLYGLGLGLILGACLLQLMNFAVIKGKDLTNDTTKASPSPTPSASLIPIVKPTTEPVASVKPVESINPPSSPALSTPIVSKTVEPSTPAASATSPKDAIMTTVVINEGMDSSQVADLFLSKAVITDRVAFEGALNRLKLDRIIHYGTYTFNPKDSIQEIINKITTVKK